MYNQICLEDLEKLRILGEGTYGKCYLVHNKKIDELCVLKQIEIFGMSQQQKQEVQKQAKILSVLNHPAIIKFYTFFKTQSYLNIVMEYADGGDLNKIIKEAKGIPFSETQILNWFAQICLAIKHIHDRKIIHRDLKCHNIFMTKEGKIKLGDFGIARHLSRTLDKIKTVVGTPYYMSPEICQNKDYSFKTDIWSLGVILYQTCAQKLPFDGNSLPVLALRISRGDYTPLTGNHYSKQLKKLISNLLQSSPNRRPGITKILENPLINKRIKNYLPQNILTRQFSHTTLHSHNIFEKQNDNNNHFEDNYSQIYLKKENPIKNKGEAKNVQCYGKKIDLNKIVNFSYVQDQYLQPDKKIEVNSARSYINNKGSKTPQGSKNIDIVQKLSGAALVSKDIKQKRKKIQAFKRRQISQPNLGPKKQIGRSEPIILSQQTQRKQVNDETIQQTLFEIISETYGQNTSQLIAKTKEHDGLFGERGSGLLTLFWAFNKFKDSI